MCILILPVRSLRKKAFSTSAYVPSAVKKATASLVFLIDLMAELRVD